MRPDEDFEKEKIREVVEITVYRCSICGSTYNTEELALRCKQICCLKEPNPEYGPYGYVRKVIDV